MPFFYVGAADIDCDAARSFSDVYCRSGFDRSISHNFDVGSRFPIRTGSPSGLLTTTFFEEYVAVRPASHSFPMERREVSKLGTT